MNTKWKIDQKETYLCFAEIYIANIYSGYWVVLTGKVILVNAETKEMG